MTTGPAQTTDLLPRSAFAGYLRLKSGKEKNQNTRFRECYILVSDVLG